MAPQIAWLFGARHFDDPTLWAETSRLLRVMLPAVLFLNLSGLVTGALYSLRRFSLPAFAVAAFNASIVIGALLRPDRIDSLAWGVLAGAIVQILMQLPGLQLGRLRWRLQARHPALRRIILLYLPIVLGVLVSQVAIAISYNLATQTGDESVAMMRYATTLIQFPVGLVATAVSVAILPTLARQATQPDGDTDFNATLAHGLRLVLILILPATVGLYVLAHPIVGLAFEHGDFLPSATNQTSIVLRYYLLGLPFAAVDQLLIFAFYARRNTLAPALVGVLSVGVYLVIAMILIRPLGLYSLMIADSVKHMVHAGVMTWLLQRHTGGLHDQILSTGAKAVLSSAVMGAAVWGLFLVVSPGTELLRRLVVVVGGGGIGLVTYSIILKRLYVPELDALQSLLVRKARASATQVIGLRGARCPFIIGSMTQTLKPETTRCESLSSSLYDEEYFLTACEGYDEYERSEGKELSRRLAAAFSAAGIQPGMQVLDVGSGRGEIVQHCAETGADAYGIDYSSVANQLAQRGVQPMPAGGAYRPQTISAGRMGFAQADAKVLPFPTGHFDRILMFDIVEHLYPWELQQALLEVRRVLKDDWPAGHPHRPQPLVRPVCLPRRARLSDARWTGRQIPARPT